MVNTRNSTSHNEQPNHTHTSSPAQNPDNLAQQLSSIASKLNALDALAADGAVLKAQAGPNGSYRGGDPRGWILKAEKYFRYYQTPDESKVEIASMYLEGDALDLFAWISAENNHLYWEELVKILHENYGPAEFQNPDEHLCNIKQTGTVQEYRQEFAKRVARVHDWPDHCLLGVFLSGLKEELKVDVRIHKPKNVFKAQLADREVEADKNEHEERINQQDMAEISFHAILGKTSGTTMKVEGTLEGRKEFGPLHLD
ncbi:hypothetical protein CTI12_AA607730 [Artemisia annua]|uniref:Retrotransposon gag domain-containing protein n=1 Tax=Artemisia annua TaxID=35608 RepID=A0A2U1KFV7_ARTAN|nr:hypothetical protein CTI12_AA607730 [Artemisia annua]